MLVPSITVINAGTLYGQEICKKMQCVHAVSVSLTLPIQKKIDKGPFITFLIIYHYLLTYIQVPCKKNIFLINPL